MLHAFAVTLAGVMLAQAAPGPNMVAVASAALGQGRRAALFTVLGVATGMLVWATLVAFGLAAVLALYPSLLTTMKLVGGSYLLFLAVKAVKAAIAGGQPTVRPASRRQTPFAAWRRGLLVILTNPKAALMWTAVATFLFGSGLTTAAVLAFGPVAFVTGSVIYGGYGLLFSTGMAMQAYARFARVIESLFGLAFGALGGSLLADGIRELRT
jgi:threonine/homoserine/homoserine lactone efflux protein